VKVLKKLSSTRLVVNGIEELAQPQFSSLWTKRVSRGGIDAEGRVLKFAALRAALPGNVLSFVLFPSALPAGRRSGKAGLAGHAPAEPLEYGHE
jgi:hypothetical protein